MHARSAIRPRDEEVFDATLLERAQIPKDFSARSRRAVFFWQTPTRKTLERLQRDHADDAILLGQFPTETPVHESRLAYWVPTDFFDLRAMLAFEQATYRARQAWNGPQEPAYEGMSLIDGDFARMGRWFDLVTCIAMLMTIRRALPDIEISSDWMGCEIVRALGMRCRRLWRADFADPNWTPRRWMRERMRGERGPLRRWRRDDASHLTGAQGEAADIVVLLAGWVERRLLDSFPIEPLTHQGLRCVLWASHRSDALDELVERTGAACEMLAEPLASPNVRHIEREVAEWCDVASAQGYFAPLRGELALRMVRMMRWPRWAPKLIAMHRRLSERLQETAPRLLLAPAEKDWAAYCGHHAARRMGIPTVGSRHGAWPAGTYAEEYGHRWFFPPAPSHVLSFTPGDAALCSKAHGVSDGTMLWLGNPRLDKPQVRVPDEIADNPCVLIGLHGTGPGSPIALRKRTRPLNTMLIEALEQRVGDRIRVRPHPWDSAEHFPAHLRHLFLPPEENLDTQLCRFAALITTYSTIALDAAAAGRPVFVWDYAEFGYEGSEVAREGAMVVRADLGKLCDAVADFLDDADARRRLIERAAHFPVYLRAGLSGGTSSIREHLASGVSALMLPRATPASRR